MAITTFEKINNSNWIVHRRAGFCVRDQTMAPTLLASPPPTPPHQLVLDVQNFCNATQQRHLHFDTPLAIAPPPPPPPPTHYVSPEDRKIAGQLAHLASQHHVSEYNRIKFGPRGAPVSYIPVSIQFPVQFKELQGRQACSVAKQAWWPCDKPAPTMHCTVLPVLEPLLGPNVDTGKATPSLSASPTIDIQQEISDAISEPITRVTSVNQLKTSETHPINISMIIPPELLPVISSHIVPSSKSIPTMFDVPSFCFLDHILAPAPPYPAPFPPPTSNRRSVMGPPPDPIITHPTNAMASAPPLANGIAMPLHGQLPPPFPSPAAVRGTVDKGFIDRPTNAESELRSNGITVPAPLTMPPPPPRLTTTDPSKSPFPLSTKLARIPTYQISRKLSPRSFSLSAPKFERATSAPPALISLHRVRKMSERLMRRSGDAGADADPVPMDVDNPGPLLLKSKTDLSFSSYFEIPPSDSPEHSVPTTPKPTPVFASDFMPISPPPYLKERATTSAFLSQSSLTSEPTRPTPITIGNMLLSSCPGKKVRLAGPVKGRGAICRDLGRDLCRVKDLGVGCIVCCLDDDELEFLGASWVEYSRVANDIGLDVLRIPTPEGFAPLSPQTMDSHLTRLINSYTLRGIPILVHCRGGVGRAGLFAACWALKLGLCQWIPPSSHVKERGRPQQGQVRESTVKLVERAIEVVRRRRSVKAIETYEQVRFLVDFVEFLASKGEDREGVD